MYKKAKAHTALLYIFGTLAIGMCVALITFIVWILVLRTDYKKTCLEINDQIVMSPSDQNFVIRDGQTYPLSSEALNYYDEFLLDKKVIVYNRKAAEPDRNSIVMKINGRTLTFTGQDEGTSVNIRWETEAGVKNYSVRTGSISYTMLNSYMKNYIRKTEPIAGEED